MSEEAAAAATPPKKSRKGLLIAVLSAVVLGGGGAGAYFGFMKHGDEEAEAKEAEPVVKLPAQFVELDPPFVSNFAPGSAARFLQITVQLQTRDPEMVEFLHRNSPILRNDLLLLFGNQHVEEVSSQQGREALRAAALESVRRVIGEEGGKPEELEAVLFTSFVMQ